jgi:hypothetical protein
MSQQKVALDNVIEVDDGSISWAIARFAAAVASDEPGAVRQALDIARQRIHDTTTLLSDLLGELRFAEGSRLAMTRGIPMRDEYEDALTLAAEYLQALATMTSVGCLAPRPARDR